MSSRVVVENFLASYQQHEFRRMHEYLAESVRFSDYAFEEITGAAVKGMWHWFCVPSESRPDPVKVPDFEIVTGVGDQVTARYRVSYELRPLLVGENKQVDYWIRSAVTVKDGLIMSQKDEFDNITKAEFAKMAFPPPLAVLANTPLLQPIVRAGTARKLAAFMRANGYGQPTDG